MTEQAKVPAIRFAGFTDPWEQRKLGEFGSVAMCKRIYKEQTSEQGDVPFFKIGTFGADPDAFISNELFEDYKRTYPYPTPGTLLISAAGSIGRIVEYQGEKAYFQDSNIVWLEHDHRLNDAFLKPLYSKIEWGLEGSTIKRLYNKDLLSAEVTIPDGREQKEIGQFFAKLDSLITLHQRKYDKLVIFKKSMLEKMFPKDGESVPEIRFAGFTDPWEQRKLEDIANRVTRKNEGESDLPLTISSQYGLVDQRTFFNNQVASKDMSGYYLLRKGEFAYNKSTSGDSPWGAVKRLVRYEKGCVSTLYICFGLDGADPDFLVTYYETDRWYKAVQMIAAEGARNHGLLNIAPNDFFDTALILPPSREEQELIGLFFARLDRLITLHQRKRLSIRQRSPVWS